MKVLVSVVLAIKNEEQHIVDCVDSLLNQIQENFDLEILLVDGMSTDRTRAIIQAKSDKDSRIKLIDNVKGITPAAFNEGIKNSKGDYIAIFGAHASYDKNYIETCLEEIKNHKADACSGMVMLNVKHDNAESELLLSILKSKIGVSPGSFRTRNSGFVESIPYGIFKKEIFDKVGLYDERLIRNQDNDMNHRIVSSGFKMYLTDKTFAKYFPKDTFLKMLKYALNTGLWNAISIKLGSYSLRFFHFVPFFFVVYLLLLLIFNILFYLPYEIRFILFIPLLTYIFLVLLAVSNQKYNFQRNFFYFPFSIFLFHCSYGIGTIKGFFKKLS